MASKKAVVLLSGGLDSATTLYYAKSKGYKCYCLLFDYGQRHKREIESAKKIARMAGCKYHILRIRLPWKGSSLLDKRARIPKSMVLRSYGPKTLIPSTYVPGRNIIFLSFALSCLEAIGAKTIFIGANARDYSGYPDCRPEFFKAFREVIRTGTKIGLRVKGQGSRVKAPLINKSKKEIVKLAKRLGVPLELTWSCYRGKKRPCGVCDSCTFRKKGFAEADIEDPIYA